MTTAGEIPPTSPRFPGAEFAIFLLIIALHLLPIWCFHWFPSQDGASHVNNAGVLAEYHRADQPILRHYYLLNHHLEPNVIGHWLLAGLMALLPAGSGNVAEKLLVSLYIITLPLAAWYAVRSINRASSCVAFLIFPFIYSLALHKGLYNFCLGLSLYFFTVGFWLRHRDGDVVQFGGPAILRPRVALPFLLLVLLACLCHLISFLMIAVTLGTCEIGLTLMDYVQQRRDAAFDRHTLWRAFARRCTIALLAAVPALVLTVLFFLQQAASPTERYGPHKLSRFLLSMGALVSYRPYESTLADILAAFLGLLTLAAVILGVMQWRANVREQRRHNAARWNILLAVVALMTLIYLRTPNAAAGGSGISLRLPLFVYFALILWLASRSWPRPLAYGIRIVPVALSLVMLAGYCRTYRQMNLYLDDYMSVAPSIPAGSTVLPVYMPDSDRGYQPNQGELSKMIRVFLHTPARIAQQRGAIDLGNYEASLSYFPIEFRPELDPAIVLDPEHTHLPDLTAYARKTDGQGQIDYVLVWDMHDPKSEGTYAAFRTSLAEHYSLIATSPLGYAKLYRRNE